MHLKALAVFAALLWAHPALSDVTVTFIHPEGYRDFESEPARTRASLLNELRTTLVDLGARYLKPGQTLKIDILNVYRAGLFRDTTGSHTALMTANTPPKIDVHYVLQQNGKVILSTQEAITDIDYFLDPSSHLLSDPLVYESRCSAIGLEHALAKVHQPASRKDSPTYQG